jgi:drug/metabolite transporter (DMT)-like permease
MRTRIALLVVVMSSACFATLAILARAAYAEGARPLPLLTWRFAIAALLMGGYLAARRPGALLGGLADLKRYALLSLTGYGAASICFFFALQYASASVVTVLLYAYPAVVAVGGALLDRRAPGALQCGAIALTFAGCALAVGLLDHEVIVSGSGVALGLGAALGYALFTMLSERLVPDRPRLVLMTYTFALSSLGIGAITLLAGESLAPQGWAPRIWGLLLLIVVLPTFAAVMLYLRGIRELGASRAAVASTLEPVFTILLAAVLLGERMTLAQSAGAALVIAGIVLSERSRQAGEAPAAL